MSKADYASAREVLNEAFEAAKKIGDAGEKALRLQEVGVAFTRLGEVSPEPPHRDAGFRA